MKVISLVLAACVLAAASAGTVPSSLEEHHGKPIQLCGGDLADAVQRICVFGDFNYLRSDQLQNLKHAHQEVHNRKGHAMKREVSSLVEKCCINACLVKDIIAHCP